MKAVQVDRILADMRIDAQEDLLLDRRKLIVGGEGHKHLVPDAVHIDYDLPRLFGYQTASELRDHRPLPLERCRSPAEGWWQMAMARASAASIERGGSRRPRSD